ncbi:hypothetical protein JCM6882_000363 [Rhodosporidiobolus microsporus]
MTGQPSPPHHQRSHLPLPSSSSSPFFSHSHLSHPFASRTASNLSAEDTPALHPTHALLHQRPHGSSSSTSAPTSDDTSWRWSSRAHRKGVPPRPESWSGSGTGAEEAGGRKREVRSEGKTAEDWREGWKWVRETRWWGWDVEDISWWVAVIFTVGSVFWCINGILFFCYFSNTSTTFYDTEAAFAFLGGTTFWVGAYLGWVEAMNPAELGGSVLLRPRRAHPSSPSLGMRRRHFGSYDPPPSLSSSSPPSSDETPTRPTWHWFSLPPPFARSTSSPSSTVSWRNIGYVANLIQFFGATAFQISVLGGLPGVLPDSGVEGGDEQGGKAERMWIAAYWAMQVLGAPCFVIAGLLLAVEVQTRWYLPALNRIGWHIGMWNVVGGFGFFFSGLFGIFRQTSLADPSRYQYWGTAFSTFWGSWAFLIGSYLQLLETLNKWS